MGNTIKITNRDLVKLHNALCSLDGSKTGINEVIPFEFAPAVSWKLAKNTVLMERAKLSFDRAVRNQARQLGIASGESLILDGKTTPDAAKLDKFLKHEAAIDEMKDIEVEISGVLFITLDELLKRPADADGKVKTNPIPQSVRSGLVPIIQDPESK